MKTATRDSIGYADYFHAENGWSLYRSFGSAEARDWYFDRLPDDGANQYRVVRHESRYFIAQRTNYGAYEA